MIERVRAAAREMLPWAALAGFTGAAVWGDIAPEMKELLVKWGPALLIFLVVAQHTPSFVRAQERQAVAITDLAAELARMSRHDDAKFQDLQIGQELILRELADVKVKLADGHRAG